MTPHHVHTKTAGLDRRSALTQFKHRVRVLQYSIYLQEIDMTYTDHVWRAHAWPINGMMAHDGATHVAWAAEADYPWWLLAAPAPIWQEHEYGVHVSKYITGCIPTRVAVTKHCVRCMRDALTKAPKRCALIDSKRLCSSLRMDDG